MLIQTGVCVSKPPDSVLFQNIGAFSFKEWACAQYFGILLIRGNRKQIEFIER